jgi:GAF domain-containing protein
MPFHRSISAINYCLSNSLQPGRNVIICMLVSTIDGLNPLFLSMLSSIYTAAYRDALRMMESGINKDEILSFLASAAEKAAGADTVVSILLIDDTGLLRNAASPKLPADYLQAIDGLKPDPNVGTCAAAAATGKVVLTPNFYADNKWAELRHLPTALGFVGAWSMPIKTNENKVVGTFGTYFRKQRQPSTEEMKGTELLASAAAAVLSKMVSI